MYQQPAGFIAMLNTFGLAGAAGYQAGLLEAGQFLSFSGSNYIIYIYKLLNHLSLR